MTRGGGSVLGVGFHWGLQVLAVALRGRERRWQSTQGGNVRTGEQRCSRVRSSTARITQPWGRGGKRRIGPGGYSTNLGDRSRSCTFLFEGAVAGKIFGSGGLFPPSNRAPCVVPPCSGRESGEQTEGSGEGGAHNRPHGCPNHRVGRRGRETRAAAGLGRLGGSPGRPWVPGRRKSGRLRAKPPRGLETSRRARKGGPCHDGGRADHRPVRRLGQDPVVGPRHRPLTSSRAERGTANPARSWPINLHQHKARRREELLQPGGGGNWSGPAGPRGWMLVWTFPNRAFASGSGAAQAKTPVRAFCEQLSRSTTQADFQRLRPWSCGDLEDRPERRPRRAR